MLICLRPLLGGGNRLPAFSRATPGARILRLPNARRKRRPELNLAYAFATSPRFKRSVVVPVPSYSIKQIGAFVGPKYSVEDPGGAQSIVWFEEFQRDRTKADVRDKLLTYNREDCLALKTVYEWLRVLHTT